MELAIADAERLGEEGILAEALTRLGVLQMWLGDNDKAEQVLRSALARADSVGNLRVKAQATYWIALVLLWGRTPVDEALRECRRLAQSGEIGQMARGELRVVEGTLLALTGEFELGRRMAADGRQALLELGQRVQYAAIAQPVAVIDLLADDAPAAERELREAHEILEAAGERGYLSTVSGLLAVALARQSRYVEADAFADQSREIGAEDDLITQIYWRVAKGLVAAARGDRKEAARLAGETMELVAHSDSFDAPMATLDIAELLEPEAARAALERALAGAQAKGSVILEAQARARLEAL